MAHLDRLTALLSGLCARTRVYLAGRLPRAHALRAATPDHLHLHLLTQGAVALDWPDGAATVGAPGLIVVAGDLAHRLVPLGEGTTVFCVRVDFCGPAAPLVLGALLQPLCLSLAEGHEDIRAIVHLIGDELAQPRCAQRALLGHAGEILLIGVLRHLIAQRALPDGVLAGLADPGLARVLVAVHERPAQAWTLERMAEEAAMSRTVFAERFRTVMGTTPGRYLGRFRLMLARRELAARRGLKQAARVAGYASPAALSRALSRAKQAQVLEQ